MVNNANPEMVDTLGSLLNIEPAFFASHLADHGVGGVGEVNTASPLASQNSRLQKEFFTIEYPCTFVTTNCGKDVDIDKLYCKGNYRRRVEVCSKHGKQKIAVARRKISFYMKKTLDPWLCKSTGITWFKALSQGCGSHHLKSGNVLSFYQVWCSSTLQLHILLWEASQHLELTRPPNVSKSMDIKEDI